VLALLPNILSISLHAVEPATTADELTAKHLDSIGSKEARAAAKTRAVQGTADYRILVGGGGKTSGKTGLVSEGHKLRFMMKFPMDYRGETFVFNGDAVKVAFSNTNQSRSPFAAFLATYEVLIRDGLFGGVLSTGWALSDIPDRKAKLVYEGLKKVDGRELHQIRYLPHKGSDVEILLYFEPDTFRHVKTVYSVSVGSNVGATIVDSVRVQPSEAA